MMYCFIFSIFLSLKFNFTILNIWRNNIHREKVSLWLLCGVQHTVIIYYAWNTTAYYNHYFLYLLSLPLKGSCRTLVIYFRYISYIAISSSFYLSYINKQLSFSPLLVCRAHVRVLVCTRLINWLSSREWRNILNYNTHTTHTRVSNTRIDSIWNIIIAKVLQVFLKSKKSRYSL